MADRLEATVKAQREFVANASHQLRTPLTGIKLRIEAAMAGAPSEEVRRQLEAADTEVDRLAGIVNRLLVMARRIEEGGPSEIDLDEAVHRALERWGERASRQGATLTAKGEGGRSEAAKPTNEPKAAAKDGAEAKPPKEQPKAAAKGSKESK